MSAETWRATELTHAVVLAAGRGTRMRARAADVAIDRVQEHAAERGLKALVPFHGQPFLSYVLTALADAAYTDVCVVVAAGPDPIRDYYERLSVRRLRLHFAVQETPLGSAHALLAAESFSDGRDIAVINSDNDYPVAALSGLRKLPGSGLIGFRRDGLLAGNIDAARLGDYATVEARDTGELIDIIEKPTPSQLSADGAHSLVSMTCWRFRPGIIDAIRATPRSVRGEYEIPDAVRRALRQERFHVIAMSERVLDLSRREDIPRIGELLLGRRVDL